MVPDLDFHFRKIRFLKFISGKPQFFALLILEKLFKFSEKKVGNNFHKLKFTWKWLGNFQRIVEKRSKNSYRERRNWLEIPKKIWKHRFWKNCWNYRRDKLEITSTGQNLDEWLGNFRRVHEKQSKKFLGWKN